MKNLIIIAAIIALILLSGCIPTKKSEFEYIYNVGTEGITVALLKDMPPATIWSNNDFTIAVDVRNKGAYTVNDALITVSGFDDRYISPAQTEQSTGELFGKSPGYPEGDIKILQFSQKNFYFPAEREEHEETFKVTAEYDYQTTATAQVCINPEMIGVIKTKTSCEVKPVQFANGQGAPIAVTRIEEWLSVADNKITVRFGIYIANKGIGFPLTSIKVSDAKLAGTQLECDAKEVELTAKEESKVVCKAVLDRGFGAYTTPLILKLNYRYASSIYQKLKITK